MQLTVFIFFSRMIFHIYKKYHICIYLFIFFKCLQKLQKTSCTYLPHLGFELRTLELRMHVFYPLSHHYQYPLQVKTRPLKLACLASVAHFYVLLFLFHI